MQQLSNKEVCVLQWLADNLPGAWMMSFRNELDGQRELWFVPIPCVEIVPGISVQKQSIFSGWD
jgi:hypothetical protein